MRENSEIVIIYPDTDIYIYVCFFRVRYPITYPLVFPLPSSHIWDGCSTSASPGANVSWPGHMELSIVIGVPNIKLMIQEFRGTTILGIHTYIYFFNIYVFNIMLYNFYLCMHCIGVCMSMHVKMHINIFLTNKNKCNTMTWNTKRTQYHITQN